MKHLLPSALLLLVAACAGPKVARDVASPGSPQPAALHPYLERLVGDWTIEHGMTMGPDEERLTMTSRETVRAMGPWIVSALTSDGPMGHIEARLSLAEDASRTGTFVGTWIDTSSSYVWVYRGWLDAAGTTLTLEAQGPDFEDPSLTRLYRDATEFTDENHRVLRSSMQQDGAWVEFMRGEARRR
jgi:hypothetical protein